MVWVLIPIAAILSGVLKTWVKQRALGASNVELEKEIEGIRRERASLLERLQNLEAIVVSQTWNAVEKPALAAAVHPHRLEGAGRQDLRAPAVGTMEEMNRQRAADLAGRLGG